MSIVVVTGAMPWSRYLGDRLADKFSTENVVRVIETGPSILQELGRRRKRYNVFQILDQVLLQVYLRLIKPWNFIPSVPFKSAITVSSINDAAFIDELRQMPVDIIICMATGILRKGILSIPKYGAINVHPGINPRYRGAGGNFWALFEENFEAVGVTIHHIDLGIDTGGILKRVYFGLGQKLNSFESVTFFAFEKAIDEMPDLISKITSGNYSIVSTTGEEEHTYGWYGLTQYIRVKRNLKTLPRHQ